MKKLLFILLICTNILESFSAGDDEFGSSQSSQGKRKWDDVNSEQSASNSNENPLIENPSAHLFQESMLMPLADSSAHIVSKNLEIFNNANKKFSTMFGNIGEAGEKEVGSSQVSQGKRKRDDDNSEQNLPNSKEKPLIEDPSTHFFQESTLMPMADSNDKSVSHSSPIQQQIMHQNLRKNSAAVINNLIGAEEKGKKPILSTNRHSKRQTCRIVVSLGFDYEYERESRVKMNEKLKALNRIIKENCEEFYKEKDKLSETKTFKAARECIIKMEKYLVGLMSETIINQKHEQFGLLQQIRANCIANEEASKYPSIKWETLFDYEQGGSGKVKKDLPITNKLIHKRKRRKIIQNEFKQIVATLPKFLLNEMELTKAAVMIKAHKYLEILTSFKNYAHAEIINSSKAKFSTIIENIGEETQHHPHRQ